MHIPNGFLDPKVSTGLGFVSAGVLAYAFAKVRALVTSTVLQTAFSAVGNGIKTIGGDLRKVFSNFGERLIIKMGLIGSLVFAAQMFNFPVQYGTSGHLVGGVLAGVTLGPWAGAIVMSIVLAIQSIFFADGGIFALGANIFNMAIVGVIGGYFVYKLIKDKVKGKAGFYLGITVASWLSVFFASFACALELALSKTYQLIETLKAMQYVHSIIGFGEVAITISIIGILKVIDASFVEEVEQ